MLEIEFNVYEKRIINPKSYIVSKSKKYINFIFIFNIFEWIGIDKYIIFKSDEKKMIRYLGESKLNETGIFIPIDNSYTNGKCICNSYQKVYIEESKLNEDVIKTDSSDTSIEINEKEIDIINYDDIYTKKDHIHTYEIDKILPFVKENINSFVDENFLMFQNYDLKKDKIGD